MIMVGSTFLQRLFATSVASIALLMLWHDAVNASESRADARFHQAVSLDSTGSDPKNFNARWSAGKTHTDTGSGTVVPALLPDKADSQADDLNDLSSFRYFHDDDTPATPVLDNARNSSPSSGGGDTEIAQMATPCGPSPLAPEEIEEVVTEAASRHGVDKSLAIAVVAVESDFDRNRNSPKGARGPMQLMPATAVRFGVSDPCEPVSNIDAGVSYLRLLGDEFGNPLLAIAAYNAGAARIYEYGGVPPFPETVSYIAKVLNHQLGLSAPGRSNASETGGAVATDGSSERGVILTVKRRQWVAGVMQF